MATVSQVGRRVARDGSVLFTRSSVSIQNSQAVLTSPYGNALRRSSEFRSAIRKFSTEKEVDELKKAGTAQDEETIEQKSETLLQQKLKVGAFGEDDITMFGAAGDSAVDEDLTAGSSSRSSSSSSGTTKSKKKEKGGSKTGRGDATTTNLRAEVITESEASEVGGTADPRLEMAISVQRMLIRSLYRIRKSNTAQISVNYELNGLLRCICSEFDIKRNHRVTDRNRYWLAQSIGQTNPHSKIQVGQEIALISPELMEGKYHLIQDLSVKRQKESLAATLDEDSILSPNSEACDTSGLEAETISTTNGESSLVSTGSDDTSLVSSGSANAQEEAPEYRQTEPTFLSYDYMLLDGRPYLRCRDHETTQYTDVFPDDELTNVRSVIRRIFKEKVDDPGIDLAEITETGFQLITLVRNFMDASRRVNKDKDRQRRAIHREFESLKRQKKTDAMKIRQSKERIKELWLRHPDPIIQERLYRVCDSMGRLDGVASSLEEPQNIEECIQEVDEILALDPLNVEALHTRAILFSMMGNHRACLVDLDQVLTFIEPRHFPSLHTLFNVHEAQGNTKGMKEVIVRLQKLCPKDPDIPSVA